jgi:hypothetical protein
MFVKRASVADRAMRQVNSDLFQPLFGNALCVRAG